MANVADGGATGETENAERQRIGSGLLDKRTWEDRRQRACTLNIPATCAEDSVTPSLNSAEYLHYNGTPGP